MTGCTVSRHQPEKEETIVNPESDIITRQNSSTHHSNSREHASRALTHDGRILVIKKDYDGAIRILERAVGINPHDGQSYFYLAEAWIGKKNYSLASQFNKLAEIYLKNDHNWPEKTTAQKKRINTALKN